jgi:hypothetical protein
VTPILSATSFVFSLGSAEAAMTLICSVSNSLMKDWKSANEVAKGAPVSQVKGNHVISCPVACGSLTPEPNLIQESKENLNYETAN